MQTSSDDIVADHLRATTILDFEQQIISDLARKLSRQNQSQREYLQAAHKTLSREISAIYTLDERQAASTTLGKGVGSCSQRFAVLEAMARAGSIPTRVRGIWVAGRFWSPRFRVSRPFIPRRILLAWPQFYVEDRWMGAESIFGAVGKLAREHPERFANNGESLFDAIEHTAIDFDGQTRSCPGAQCDLSQFVIGEAGMYATRDALFAGHPQLQRSFRGISFELLLGGKKST
jgi:transglutaminase-like putative cysteine protease